MFYGEFYDFLLKMTHNWTKRDEKDRQKLKFEISVKNALEKGPKP
jgi:hypothetical protein